VIGALSDREETILELLADEPTISVVEVSKRLDVSAVTIRGDLSALAEKGLIVRERGRASAAIHPGIIKRQRNRVDEKSRIAKAAANLIGDRDTVMIEAGTTTALVARYLLGKSDLHVVTTSMLVVPFARYNPSLRLTVVGGEFRPDSESVVGPVALRQLDGFHVNTAFVGTDGLTLEHGLTTHLIEGAEVVRTMAEHAERTVLVADSSKFGHAGFYRILPLEAVDILITDSGLSDEDAESIGSRGVSVMRV